MIHVIPCLYLLQPFSYKFIPRFMNIHIRIFGCCLKLGHPEPLLLHRYPFQTWPVWIMSSSKKSLETVGWTRCSTTDGSKSNYVQPMEPEILRSHIYIHLHTSTYISYIQIPSACFFFCRSARAASKAPTASSCGRRLKSSQRFAPFGIPMSPRTGQ